MREAGKVLCVIIFMVATPAAAVAWFDEHPGTIESVLRYACPVLAVASIGAFLKLHFRPDEAPDYLRQQFATYFNRGGFCFAVRPTVADGIAYLDVYFQNQQDTRCVGRIALRPARGFFLGRADLEPIAVEIRCEPAAYGFARIPVAIPAELQGRKQSFEVGASVDRPSGRGRTLRFRDGTTLRANSDFGNAFGTTLTVAGALTAQIMYRSHATTAIELPREVAPTIPAGREPEIRTLWKLGDPPIGEIANATQSSHDQRPD
jgi:hypothetical protein